MLKINGITKKFAMGDSVQVALDNVSLNFRDSELVAILGPSGSGKTTLLNIIGGLDNFYGGNLSINGVSTHQYNGRDWDSYRNHTIGFIFQNYNLIMHQSILSNVELALTISNTPKAERKKRALEALEKVGLADHVDKKPSQLSGGQMQRVAIARALVNDPEVLLADEPTGALDSETSLQVMDLLKEVAKDRLVIMVTHNAELAQDYATRIVNFKDGKVMSDTNPYDPDSEEKVDIQQNKPKNNKRVSMSFITSILLSFSNLKTKKGRSILTAVASSVGIIGIALILSISNGVNDYMTTMQQKAMSSYPITIQAETFDMLEGIDSDKKDDKVKHDMKAVYSDNTDMEILSNQSKQIKTNDLKAFKKYLDNSSSEIHKYVGKNGISYAYDSKFKVYTYDANKELVNTDGSTLKNIENDQDDISNMLEQNVEELDAESGSDASITGMTGNNALGFSELISNKDEVVSSVVSENYNVVYGKMPEKYDEIVLVLNKNNELSLATLFKLGFLPTKEYKEAILKMKNGEEPKFDSQKLSYEDICKKEFTLIPECDFYKSNKNKTFDKLTASNDIQSLTKNGVKLKITGILRPSKSDNANLISTPLAYTRNLTDYLRNYTEKSSVVKSQKSNPKVNILTNEAFKTAKGYENNLAAFGVVSMDSPSSISIYTDNFEDKKSILGCIEKYNKKVDAKEKITYVDTMEIITSYVTKAVDGISYVLIALVAVSLVVSAIMIGIITYISVLERRKEIGILRALGASKRNISQVFNAETLLVGLGAGIIGIVVNLLLLIPINLIAQSTFDADISVSLPILSGVALVIVSIILNMIGGYIPSQRASREDPIIALRGE